MGREKLLQLVAIAEGKMYKALSTKGEETNEDKKHVIRGCSMRTRIKC
jgi:hypothetical protein